MNKPPRNFEIIINVSEDDDIDDVLADAISNEYGFCHYGFDYKIIKENNSTKLVKVTNVDWDLSE